MPVQPHFVEPGQLAQIDCQPFLSPGRRDPRAAEMLRSEQGETLSIPEEQPFLPLDSLCIRNFQLDTPAFGSDALRCFPCYGKNPSRDAGKVAHGLPGACFIQLLQAGTIGCFRFGLRQLDGCGQRHAIDGFEETVCPEREFCLGTFHGYRGPGTWIQRDVVLDLGEGLAVISADFHPPGGLRFDDAVHGQLGRGVVVDGAGVVGGMQQGEVVEGNTAGTGGQKERSQCNGSGPEQVGKVYSHIQGYSQNSFILS